MVQNLPYSIFIMPKSERCQTMSQIVMEGIGTLKKKLSFAMICKQMMIKNNIFMDNI